MHHLRDAITILWCLCFLTVCAIHYHCRDVSTLETTKTKVYSNCGISLTHKRSAGTVEAVTSFLHEAGPDFGMKNDDNLQVIESKSGLGCHVYRYRQLSKDGFPIIPSDVTVTTDVATTELHSISVLYSEIPQDANMLLKLPLKDAVAYAKRHALIKSLRQEEPYNPEIVMYYKTDSNEAMPCWQFVLLSASPLGDYKFIIDASKHGPVVVHEVENLMRKFTEGTGRVYIPNPIQTLGMQAIRVLENEADAFPGFAQAGKTVKLHNLESGTDLLIGKYVNPLIRGNNEDACSQARSSTREYVYERDDPRFSQVMVYYHVDRVQRLIQSLGYTGDRAIRDFPMLVAVQSEAADVSYFSPFERPASGGIIHMGEGGVNDAQDGDIIVHEYAHAIQYSQNANFYGGEMPAMGEGFGDWLAAIMFAEEGDANYQQAHAGCIGEWDTDFIPNANVLNYPRCLRRVDHYFMLYNLYHRDAGGNQDQFRHFNGMIWSSALWEVYKAIGLEQSLKIVLESHFGLPMGSTMPMGARAILDANRAVRDGKDEYRLRVIFHDRGILSLDEYTPPPTTEAPTTEPPTTEPPTTEPPTTEPPTTQQPTTQPPTLAPTLPPTTLPPTITPTEAPTEAPTAAPTVAPTAAPTEAPTIAPTVAPTTEAPLTPTDAPVAPTEAPNEEPTMTTDAPADVVQNPPQHPPTISPTVVFVNPKDSPVPLDVPVPASAPVNPSTGSNGFRCIGGVADRQNKSCDCVDEQCLCYAEGEPGVSCHCNDVDWCIVYTSRDTTVYGGTTKSLLVYWTDYSTIFCENAIKCACYGGHDSAGACYQNGTPLMRYTCVQENPENSGQCQ